MSKCCLANVQTKIFYPAALSWLYDSATTTSPASYCHCSCFSYCRKGVWFLLGEIQYTCCGQNMLCVWYPTPEPVGGLILFSRTLITSLRVVSAMPPMCMHTHIHMCIHIHTCAYTHVVSLKGPILFLICLHSLGRLF